MPKEKPSNENKVIQFIANRARGLAQIKRVFLFGSRARGDEGERSDFDIAIEAPGLSHQAWSAWVLEVKEQAPTLCGIDLVLLSPTTSHELIDTIKKQGIVIYEKN